MTLNAQRLVAARISGSPSRRPGRASRRAINLRDGLLFLAPFLLVYALFLLYPVLQSAIISGFSWDLLGADPRFIGLDNYTRMLWGTNIVWSIDHAWLAQLVILAIVGVITFRLWRRPKGQVGAVVVGALGFGVAFVLGFHPAANGAWNDDNFWTSLKNTLAFTLISTPILVVLGLALALVLNNKRRGGAFYRAIFFLPYVLPVSAVTLVWSYMLNPDRGLVAGFLHWFGMAGIPFLSDPNLALPAIVATTVWWSVGFNLVLFLAGLQDIEPSLYEAASLDGANWWNRFRHVTVPGLSHVFVLVIITQVIASFQVFGQVYIMTKGGPGTATEVLIQHIYEAGFKNYQLGYASALSVFLFVVMAAVSAIQFRLIAKDA